MLFIHVYGNFCMFSEIIYINSVCNLPSCQLSPLCATGGSLYSGMTQLLLEDMTQLTYSICNLGKKYSF